MAKAGLVDAYERAPVHTADEPKAGAVRRDPVEVEWRGVVANTELPVLTATAPHYNWSSRIVVFFQHAEFAKSAHRLLERIRGCRAGRLSAHSQV